MIIFAELIKLCLGHKSQDVAKLILTRYGRSELNWAPQNSQHLKHQPTPTPLLSFSHQLGAEHLMLRQNLLPTHYDASKIPPFTASEGVGW